MATSRMDRLESINSFLESEYKEGYDNGIVTGYAVAQSIMAWCLSNHQLKEPHSHETLEKWSKDALAGLKAKLGREPPSVPAPSYAIVPFILYGGAAAVFYGGTIVQLNIDRPIKKIILSNHITDMDIKAEVTDNETVQLSTGNFHGH